MNSDLSSGTLGHLVTHSSARTVFGTTRYIVATVMTCSPGAGEVCFDSRPDSRNTATMGEYGPTPAVTSRREPSESVGELPARATRNVEGPDWRSPVVTDTERMRVTHVANVILYLYKNKIIVCIFIYWAYDAVGVHVPDREGVTVRCQREPTTNPHLGWGWSTHRERRYHSGLCTRFGRSCRFGSPCSVGFSTPFRLVPVSPSNT